MTGRPAFGLARTGTGETAFTPRTTGQVTEGTHSLERGHALGQAHERLDDDEVDACGKQRLSLFGVEVQQTVIRAIFAGENRLAGGRHVSRDERVRADGLARERNERTVQRRHLVLQPVVRQQGAVRAEGRCEDDLAARVHIGSLEGLQRFRMRADPRFAAHASGHTRRTQIAAGCAVKQTNMPSRPSLKCFPIHGQYLLRLFCSL